MWLCGLRWWWRWGSAFENMRQERGLGAKSHENEHDGSIWRVLCEIVPVEGDEGMWFGCEVEVVVVVVVGLCVCKHEAGEGAGGQNP